jgi:uncharacterized protein YlaN (UPF0358 family)
MKFLTLIEKNIIPQNDNLFFEITTKLNWKSSLDILFNPFEKLNLSNLFLILKIYIGENFPKVKQIYMISHDASSQFEKKILIFRSVNIFFLKKMNFEDFCVWYHNIFQNDYEYLKSTFNYGFRVTFYSQSLDKINLNSSHIATLKPVYPWTTEILSIFNVKEEIKFESTNFVIDEENKKLKKEIFALEQELSKLKKIFNIEQDLSKFKK